MGCGCGKSKSNTVKSSNNTMVNKSNTPARKRIVSNNGRQNNNPAVNRNLRR